MSKKIVWAFSARKKLKNLSNTRSVVQVSGLGHSPGQNHTKHKTRVRIYVDILEKAVGAVWGASLKFGLLQHVKTILGQFMFFCWFFFDFFGGS